jgi:hypothetical protein
MTEVQLISIAIIVGLISLYLIISILKKGLRQTAIDLIVEAEKSFGKGQGKEKMHTVVVGIVTAFKLPTFTINIVEWLVQGIFDEVKKCLDYTPEEKGE